MDASLILKIENILRIFKDAEERNFSNLQKPKRTYHINTLHAIEEEFCKKQSRDYYKTFRKHLSKFEPPTLIL